ncbi:MAG: SGNH/GDSL hydrolase family protein [Oscillospiraceae bacterium]|nr:SGNH/GDSL hydrolase family protein [Oscillospiraceae bacterium]
MKLLFIGDSITDMCRNREWNDPYCYGNGYVFLLESALSKKYPKRFEIINRGISGNRIVDIYQRIKADCWNHDPDVVTIMVGVNDVYHEIKYGNGVDQERFERIYDMMIADTKKVLPNAKFIIMGSFVLEGKETAEQFKEFCEIKEYAEITRKIAQKHGCLYISLQEQFDALAEQYGGEYFLFDGIHPTVAGANVIAENWLECFENHMI